MEDEVFEVQLQYWLKPSSWLCASQRKCASTLKTSNCRPQRSGQMEERFFYSKKGFLSNLIKQMLWEIQLTKRRNFVETEPPKLFGVATFCIIGQKVLHVCVVLPTGYYCVFKMGAGWILVTDNMHWSSNDTTHLQFQHQLVRRRRTGKPNEVHALNSEVASSEVGDSEVCLSWWTSSQDDFQLQINGMERMSGALAQNPVEQHPL